MTALNAPRHLNEWECCIDSSFSHTSAPDRSDNHDERTSGVRRTYGAILRRACRTSSRVISFVACTHHKGHKGHKGNEMFCTKQHLRVLGVLCVDSNPKEAR